MIFKPETYHLTIFQGADLREEFAFSDSNGSPVDLSGALFQAQIRTDFAAITASDLTVTVIDASAGVFAVTMPLSATTLLATSILSNSREIPWGVWDLEAVIGGDKSRLLQGNVVVSREVTK